MTDQPTLEDYLVSKRPLQWLAALCLLGLMAGACSSNGSTSSNNGKKKRVVKDTSLYPASVLNKAQNEGTPKYGGTVTFGMESGVLNYSPNNKVIQPSDLAVEVSVFDSLITYDDKSQPVLDNSAHKYNQLADSLTSSKDLKTWTLKLRPGIKFSNGDPLTADEVVKHTNWIKSNASLCSCQDDANNIDTITAGADGLTVTYKLKAANVAWPDKLSNGGLGWITDSKAREAAPDPINPDIKHLVGTGPFVFQSSSGDSYTVVKNPNYYGVDAAHNNNKLPYLDKIVFRPLADPATRLQAVQSNGVQIMQTADSSNIVQAKKDKNLVVQPVSGSSSTILVLNLNNAPFGVVPSSGTDAQAAAIKALDDPTAKKARIAFATGIDRNEINQKYYGGARVPAYGFIPSTSPYYDPKGELPHFNRAAATKVVTELKAAKVDTDIHAMCIPGPEATGIFQILQQQGNATGLKSKLTTVEQGVLVNTLLTGQGTAATKNWNVACFRAPQIADPDGVYNSLHTGGPTNLVKYSRKNVDNALDKGRTVSGVAARKPYYDIVQEQVAKDAIYIPLLFDYYGNIHQANVSGLGTPSPDSLGLISLAGLYYKK
jgi:ABC-type transport system substrate-binding protein